MSETPDLHPFHQWVDAARPRGELWRTIIGTLIIVGAWIGWTLLLMLVAIGGGLISRDALGAVLGASYSTLGYWDTIIALLVALGTIWGFAIGVWLAVKFLHARQLDTVVSWDRRFSLREFGVGCFLALIYLIASIVISAVTGHLPRRSNVDIDQWLLSLGPIAVVIFLQGASEELVFRGYLPQQLAARFRNPLVWGLLPSIVFGTMHAGNMPGDPSFMPFLIISATVLGLVMMATVWRTGSLAAAMGLHFVNNVVALTVAGSDSGSSTVALFVWSPGEMMNTASADLLVMGLLLAFVLSPWAPLPKKAQPLARKNETRAAP